MEVDEQGTKAAAATAVPIMQGPGAQLPEFRAGHPFVFLIRDPQSGTIVFLGRVTDPS
jgi:serpin B